VFKELAVEAKSVCMKTKDLRIKPGRRMWSATCD
jgi:hypothetical protein